MYKTSICNDKKVFYHGTKADLKKGDFIKIGCHSNYGKRRKANFVYFSATMNAAIWGAELAEGNMTERIYIVEPTGDFEDDPNLTDKKFKGNNRKGVRVENDKKYFKRDCNRVGQCNSGGQRGNYDGVHGDL